jgi:hypothetical protein
MSFETTVRAFAAALGEPSAPPPTMTHGRLGAPDVHRFAVYRNNVAVGLIGALEARYPVSRRLTGDELFRAMARVFARACRPRSPVMIAYGAEFPEFVSEYLAASGAAPAFNWDRHRDGPQVHARGGEAVQSRSSGPSCVDRFAIARRERGLFRRPLARDEDYDRAQFQHAIACLVDVARLENAWVEAYHAEDAATASLGDLAALDRACLPETRIAFHPAAQLLRFATPAASVWASAQNSDHPAAPIEGHGEDALVTRPDCDVRVRVLPPLAYDFALKMQEGATLIEAFTCLDDPEFDFGAHLVGLVVSGAVASLIPGRTT